MGSAAARGVVVVDRRPLERNLVRFILQENGFEVRAEAATPVDALRAVAQQRPAVVVLHENAAWEGGRPTIPQLRQALPDAKILVIAPAFGVVRVELLRDADAVLEEGIGFKDLPFVIGRLASGEATRNVSEVREPTLAASPSRPFRERWVNRFQGATAAAVVFLTFMISGAAGPPGPERVGATPAVALRQAKDSLENFRAASKDPSHDLLGLAADLAAARAAAVDAGANVSTLDADIFALVNEVLPDVPQDVAETLLLLFDDVHGLGTSTPTPTPPTPEPSPSEEASPTPTASATVAPDEASGEESPAPDEETPSEDPSPRPTEEPSPRPTEEPSPSPTEEPSPTATQEPSPREQPRPSPTQEPSSEEPSPSPTEEPSVSPTESPTGTASATTTETATPSPPATTTTPLPSETASPTTTGTFTPSPTGTTTSPTGTTPAPTGTTMSPTGTASPTGSATADGVAVLVLPPSIGVLASAVARRRARRSRR